MWRASWQSIRPISDSRNRRWPIHLVSGTIVGRAQPRSASHALELVDPVDAAQPTMNDCLFCRIADGREPASVIERTASTMSFLDLYGVRDGHALVIPRRHAVSLQELAPAERHALFDAVARVQIAQRAAGLRADGYTLLVNDGPAAGQHVPHVHVHVVPRARGDTFAVIGRFVLAALNRFGRPRRRADLDAIAARLRERMPPPAADD